MNNASQTRSGQNFSMLSKVSRKAAIALIAAPMLWSTSPFALVATAAASEDIQRGGGQRQLTPSLVAQRQQDWDCNLRMARLVDERQRVTALVLQLDVLDKPETTYANVIYQVFGKVNGRWKEIFTNTGARLITNNRGRLILAPEVIRINDLRDALVNDRVDLETIELKVVAMIRYDQRRGRRDRRVSWESVGFFNQIATTRTTQLVATRTTTTTTRNTTQVTNRVTAGHFSLAIRQARVTLPEVIARVSLKPRRGNTFLNEQFIGDFRYRMNQRAEFVRGLSEGDRVVVRLFTLNNRLIGYSEFELLSNHAAVTLVLPEDARNFGTVRTVYGLDVDRDAAIDNNTAVYDYFTQVSGTTLRETRVTFLENTRTINTRLFQLQGLPTPPSICTYTTSFQRGSFALVSRTISIFSRSTSAILTSLPGTLVDLISLSATRVSVFRVVRQITTYERYQERDGYVLIVDRDRQSCNRGCDDDDDDDNRRRRHCNQGIGNGAEGCDPGNSRPHGGSNDEDGRRPRRRR